MTPRITLQNTPSRKGAIARSVSFDSHGNLLQGALYLPETAATPLPAVVVTGAWTTVKEQMAGTYARELAVRGYAALAFDFTGWGQSEGSPRLVEDPATKTADIHAAAAFMAAREEIDPARIAGLGICASSGYMAAAVADDDKFQRVALVAPWLHDPAMAEDIYGGADAVAGLIAASEAEGAADTVLPGAGATDANAVMVQVPYYTEADRGLIPAYDNKFSVASWKPWLTYDAQASADRLTKPMLMVGSPAIALPAGAEAYAARARASVKSLWLGKDVAQFDFYDREDVVTASADAIAEFLAV
ncbi:MAG: lysophospholipase [Synechococcus sp. SB0676_bin_10]|uniref:Lysophospholipase n=1 Tax=Synechococcus sp. SB0676_bin_10 TaxID=2604869 RepID=A0A6B1F7L8_9SYNE|nr:lysophospholipase [Synechococcus sp. SB0676_bin_10]